jgi:hypothetical protein
MSLDEMRAAILKARDQYHQAVESATDSMVALGRAFESLQREAEEQMTTDERLRYYELRDKGVPVLDALCDVIGPDR